MYIFSKIKDENIFHIFAFDIIRYYHPKVKKAFIYRNVDLSSACQKWRHFVMKQLYSEVAYTNQKYIISKKWYSGYDSHRFIRYPPSDIMKHIYHRIQPKKTKGNYILIQQRKKGDRYLYDYNTKLPLDQWLNSQDLPLPMKTCCFGKMTPDEQYQICENSAIFIGAHGAGCTNIIFTPEKTPLIEISLRKHWYCDPVCNKHLSGKLDVNQKCQGKLCYRPYYHKADYHNLCYLLGKEYHEIEPFMYGGGFNSRNPISKQDIYVKGEVLLKLIHTIYTKSFEYNL